MYAFSGEHPNTYCQMDPLNIYSAAREQTLCIPPKSQQAYPPQTLIDLTYLPPSPPTPNPKYIEPFMGGTLPYNLSLTAISSHYSVIASTLYTQRRVDERDERTNTRHTRFYCDWQPFRHVHLFGS